MKDSLVAQTDAGSIPGLEKSLGKGNDYPIQDSCLENSMDRGARWATAYGITKSQIWLKKRIMIWLLCTGLWHCSKSEHISLGTSDQLSFNVSFLVLLCFLCSIHFPLCIWRIGDSKNPTFISTLKIYQDNKWSSGRDSIYDSKVTLKWFVHAKFIKHYLENSDQRNK